MMDMVSLTRVGIVAAAAGAMRRNTVEALDAHRASAAPSAACCRRTR